MHVSRTNTFSIFWQNFLGIVWFICLALAFLHFFRKRLALKKAKQWPQAIGYVTRFSLIQEEDNLRPEIEYSYQIDEETFYHHAFFLEGIPIHYASKHARLLAYQIARAYEEKAPITVHYNPQNPNEAILDCAIPLKLNLILLLLVSLMGLHVILTVYSWWFQ